MAPPAPGGLAVPTGDPAAGAPSIPQVTEPPISLLVDTGQTCPAGVTRAALLDDPALATVCAVEALERSGEFEFVEKNWVFSHTMERPSRTAAAAGPLPLPNDPLLGMQWSLRANGSAAGQSAGGAGFERFWQVRRQVGDRRVRVAVIDTGLDLSHPDIARSANVAPGFDFVSNPEIANDGNGRDADPNDPGDSCEPGVPPTFHGTHVAGTIGAAVTNNGAGIASGAWNVTLVPVRAMGRCGGALSDINDAIRWAAGLAPARTADGRAVVNANPADIINLSLGLFETCPRSMQEAIDAAVARGVVVVAAAGNARVPVRFYAPAGCRNVITVAAGDARGMLAPYSNYGPEVALMAPGGDVARDDDRDGRPDGILSTRRSTGCLDPVTGASIPTCWYGFDQGTSMAAPHVAAALALLKGENPTATNAQIANLMLTRATAPRIGDACVSQKALYPGGVDVPGRPGFVLRGCGVGLLDLGRVAGPP
jgi:serine protease